LCLGGAPGLCFAEPALRLAGGAEKVLAAVGQLRVGLVPLLRLAARLRPAGDPRSHGHLGYLGVRPGRTPGRTAPGSPVGPKAGKARAQEDFRPVASLRFALRLAE